MAKQKKNTGNNNNKTNNTFWGRELEYIMPKKMYDDLTKEVKGDKKQYAIDYINQTYGLLGHVTSLVIEDVIITGPKTPAMMEDVMPL